MGASDVRRWKYDATRKLAWFHRWLGVATCLVFALWFASGTVLLFKPFPSLSRDAQFALEPMVDLGSVRLTPAVAWAAGGARGDTLRLVQRGGTPAYVMQGAGGTVVVDARSGNRLPLLSAAEAAGIGDRMMAARPVAQGPFDYDQWVVHDRFDPWRPFFRLDAGDAAGTQYYVSARTGEIVQRTARAERGWNWVGAVLHWVYFTPIRSNFTVWDRSVWLLSFVAMLVAVAGTILGLVRMATARRQKKPAWTFFRLRWMRWHHLLGLVAGWFVLAWVFSGWLSMDHDRLFFDGRMTPDQRTRYEGSPLPTALAAINPKALQRLVAAKEVEFSVVAGRAVMTAWRADGRAQAFDENGRELRLGGILALAGRGIAAAWGTGGDEQIASMPVGANDLFLLTEGWPATAILMHGNGNRPDLYVDSATGKPLTVMNASRKARAWLYYGLHTYKYPGLVDHPALRQTIMLIPLLLGFLFSITGIVIGMKRIRQSL